MYVYSFVLIFFCLHSERAAPSSARGRRAFAGVARLLTSARSVVECYALVAGVAVDNLKEGKAWALRMSRRRYRGALPHVLLEALARLGWQELYNLCGAALRGVALAIFRSIHISSLIDRAITQARAVAGGAADDAAGEGEELAARNGPGLRRVHLIVALARRTAYPTDAAEFARRRWGDRIARPLRALCSAPSFASALDDQHAGWFRSVFISFVCFSLLLFASCVCWRPLPRRSSSFRRAARRHIIFAVLLFAHLCSFVCSSLL